MASDYNLDRFVDAQRGIFDHALAELRAGQKRSHWMWFIFPQIAGLGRSPTAQHYAIQSIAEARAYLADPLLGPRYVTAVEALQALPGGTAERVFGAIDALKLASSLTLFEAAGGPPIIAAAIDRWCGGTRDDATLAILRAG